MRAKVITKPGIDSGEPTVRNVGEEIRIKPLNGDPTKTAFENGVPAVEYAKRRLQALSADDSNIIKAAKVQDALRKQGYSGADALAAVEELGLVK